MGAGGKVVHYVMEAINQVYRLLNHDLEAFTEKDCASGAWLASNFISPSGNISNILVLRAQIVSCVLDDVLLNIGHLIVNELWEFKMHDSISLLIPSLITELCKQVEVEKRKIDYVKSVHVEDDSLLPPVGGDFESFASELRVVKELVAKQSQGPGESSVGTKSYVPQSEFDASQFANLEKAYASLAQSHGELSISHSKIKKREKSRDKQISHSRLLELMRKRMNRLHRAMMVEMRITRPPRLMERIEAAQGALHILIHQIGHQTQQLKQPFTSPTTNEITNHHSATTKPP
ncbi:hypothetical protein KY285_012248 [Solanum tuberosum]|nr:hypothetical protein KY289_011170 [Solanum tuberosum]KAH0736541.1 hypothetical protein KY285_012248 [Solanum tuberosum]